MTVRKTRVTIAVLRALRDKGPCTGYVVIRTAQLASGTVYPILYRLDAELFVAAKLEGMFRTWHLTPAGRDILEELDQ